MAGADAYLAEIARIKSEREMEKYRKTGAALQQEYELAQNTPENPRAVEEAKAKYLRHLDIGLGPDSEKAHGLIGLISNLIHHSRNQREATQQALQAAQTSPQESQFNALMAARGVPQMAPPTMEQAVAAPPPSPAEVNRATTGAAEAVTGTTPGTAPVNAAAGAGAATPTAVAAAAQPPIMAPPPFRGTTPSVAERQAANAALGLAATNKAARDAEAAELQQRMGFLQIPEIGQRFKDLTNLQALGYMLGPKAGLPREIAPQVRLNQGAPRALTAEEAATFNTDVETGLPLRQGETVVPVTNFGRLMGFTRFDPRQVGGVLSLTPEGQVVRTGFNAVTGQAGPSQPLPGTPLPLAIAGAPTRVSTARGDFIKITKPDGTEELLPVTKTGATETRKMIPGVTPGAAPPTLAPPPGASAPPASTPAAQPPARRGGPSARVSGPPIATGGVRSPLTMGQREKLEGGLNATDRALVSIERLQKNIDVLDSPLVAGAIQIQVDPHSGNITTFLSGKALEGAGKEKARQFAADLRAAMEDINVIRGAFGATAFRGKEGFNAMVSQVGANRLLGSKDILSRTLTKTIGDLKSIRDVQSKYLQPGQPAPPGLAPPPGAAERVKVSKGGKEWTVPRSQLQQALDEGYTEVK